MVPVLKSWKQLGVDLEEAPPGTRASMDGEVPETTTYGSWLKKQPAAVQDEVLGHEKGLLFRRGTVPIEKFVDTKFRPLTLTELESLEARLE